jgi:hypothetical protein
MKDIARWICVWLPPYVSGVVIAHGDFGAVAVFALSVATGAMSMAAYIAARQNRSKP